MRIKIEVQKLHALTGHRDSIYTIRSAHNPQYFYSAGSDGFLVKWDVENPENGQLIAQFPKTIYALEPHPEQNWLYIGQNFEGVHLIDLQTNTEIKSTQITRHAIFDILFFQNRLAVACGDGRVVILDAETLETLKNIPCSEKSARTLTLNPAQNELAVGYSDNFIRIFDWTNFELKYEFQAHDLSVFTLRYSPDYQFLMSGGRDAHLKIWHTKNYELQESIVAHLYTINHIAFSPSGRFFATCSKDKSIKIWDAKTFKLLKVIDKGRHAGHGTSVNKLIWSPHSKQLISGSDDRSISVWDLQFFESAN